MQTYGGNSYGSGSYGADAPAGAVGGGVLSGALANLADTFSGITTGGSGASMAATNANDTFAGTTVVHPAVSLAITNASDTFSGAASTSIAILTEPLKNNSGTLLANETGATAFVYDTSSGALVVKKTGQTTNSSGVMTIYDALLSVSTTYRVVVVLSSGAEGMAKYST